MSVQRRGAIVLLKVGVCGLLTLGYVAKAATLCVNSGGTSGCYATIGAAVSAAKANDQVNIAAGQYGESVVVTKPLSLVGAGSNATIINARGLSYGVYINGLDNGGLSNVLVTGLTVLNANYEGILVTNASFVVISENHVTDNDQSLNYAAAMCPGQPAFETNEGTDCGEGIHLVGVDHATVANNVIDQNSGGMLLSDETGPTYSNLITGNSVHDNALACGITLASHPPSPQASSKLPYGVFENSVIGNNISNNGHIAIGAGVGIYAAGPGNAAFSNKVIGNTIMNNGLPGVVVHNHAAPPGAPGINLNDIMIVGNFISGNGADTADAATPGTAGINIYGVAAIYGTIIAQNDIQNEAVGVAMNNPGSMELHLNNLSGGATGVTNLGQGSVNAALNFFGCAGGPGSMGCGSAKGSGVVSTPWLSAPVGAGPTAAPRGPR